MKDKKLHVSIPWAWKKNWVLKENEQKKKKAQKK